jgi:uncharacterized protein (TIGR02588 family)
MPTKGSKKQAAATDTVEWIIAVLGIAILATALGFILYRAVSGEDKQASLSVSIESVDRSEQGFRVDFIVSNSGSQTAAAVQIEGELSKAGQSVEKSSATLTYSPASSTRRGALFFTHDPNSHEMRIRATGFEKP